MMTLHKYAQINDLICQLTNNKSLRTFYILFLMAETDEERFKLNETFNEASLSLEGEELNILKRDFTDSFKKVLPLLKDLNKRITEFGNDVKMHQQAA